MKLTADRDGNVRYFSAKLGLKEKFDPKEIDMLSAGAVPMLIPPAAVQGRRNNILRFDISAYTTLEFYLSCILSREQFAELLLQCVDVFHRMQKVYLNYKDLVFDLDKVYVQLNDRTIHFIYLPLMSSKREATIQGFFQKMISKTGRSTYEQSVFLDACLAWLKRPGSFILDEFESFVRNNIQLDNAIGQPEQPKPAPIQQMASQPERVYRPVSQERSAISVGSEIQGETSRLAEPVGGTVLLGASEPVKPDVRFYLVRTQTNEKIELTEFPFLVGSELGGVSYCISGNSAVSRRHAEFTMQDGECFISDQKSTNKSYVNDCALVPHTAQVLSDGDHIRLANEKFTFVREEKA